MSDLSRNDFDVIPEAGPLPAPIPSIQLSLLTLHNELRSIPLTLNDKLIRAAQQHSDWMAANDQLSHVENVRNFQRFVDRAKAMGYNMTWGGENVAYGSSSAEGAFQQWRNSPPHRSNMVNARFQDVGFGMTLDANGVAYWCAVFGSEKY